MWTRSRSCATTPGSIYYYPPPVPVVANVPTTTTPLWVSIGKGAVYWSVSAVEGTTTVKQRWRYDIASHARTKLPASYSVPAAERWRYYYTMLTSPKVIVRAYDKLPRLSFSVSNTRPVYETSIRTSGHLVNASGKPFVGGRVFVDEYVGDSWRQLAMTYTTWTGAWSVCCVPRGWKLRARFGSTKAYAPATSSEIRMSIVR